MPSPRSRIGAVAIVILSAVVQPCLAAERPSAAAQQPTKFQDVVLTKDRLLIGQVLSGEGKPIVDGKVWVTNGSGDPIAASTDAQGRFAYRGLTSGVYCLQAGEAVRLCRVWSSEAAPPAAVGALLMVADEGAVRGQSGPPPLLNNFVTRSKKFFAHPAGMVVLGAAIATPIVLIAADDDDPPPASP